MEIFSHFPNNLIYFPHFQLVSIKYFWWLWKVPQHFFSKIKLFIFPQKFSIESFLNHDKNLSLKNIAPKVGSPNFDLVKSKSGFQVGWFLTTHFRYFFHRSKCPNLGCSNCYQNFVNLLKLGPSNPMSIQIISHFWWFLT